LVTELLTYAEAGERMRVSARTVRRLVHDRMLAVTVVRGRGKFVTAAEVERYLVERTRGRVA
jgi:excisionase family DNA binding protein